MGSLTETQAEPEPDSVSISKFKETFFLVVLVKNRDGNGHQTSTLHMWRITMTSQGVGFQADNKGLKECEAIENNFWAADEGEGIGLLGTLGCRP